MTETQKRVLMMMINDKTITEISEELGVSKQNVWEIAQNAVRGRGRSAAKRYAYYPEIQRYIAEQNITVMGLSRRSGVTCQTLIKMLKYGKTVSMNTLYRLIDCTGLSADEVMRRGE